MDSKEFIQNEIDNLKSMLKNGKKLNCESIIKCSEEEIEQFNQVLKDLEMLEELKCPYDEYENEKYLCRREAYYNEYLGELCFGYTIYEWNGEYKERYLPVLKKTIKEKLWKEVFHAGTSSEKKELNEEYIQDFLKLRELTKGKKDEL